ncbi:MAG TPA: DUF3592 domain-containing protein [Pirellulales bacterium]|nr:DUF3592 domain-containing protein [Pirellulales bacterium]
MSKKRPSAGGRVFLVLFSLPFASVGVIAAVSIFWAVWSWNDMQSWDERSATILQVELETNRGSDSTTHRVTARYEYEYSDVKYTSTRVGIHSFSDNVGRFHQRAADELNRYRKSREPFPCYVDPANPNESILYRNLRFEILGFMSLFAVLFGSVGFGLLFWSVFSVKLEQQENKLVAEFPDQPWKQKPAWADGKVHSSNKRVLLAALGFAAFWNLVSAPVLFFVPAEVRQGNYLALLALIFPAVGLGLAIWAVRCLLQWLKYRDSVFEMASVPGVIGGQLAGVVQTKRNLDSKDGCRVGWFSRNIGIQRE